MSKKFRQVKGLIFHCRRNNKRIVMDLGNMDQAPGSSEFRRIKYGSTIQSQSIRRKMAEDLG